MTSPMTLMKRIFGRHASASPVVLQYDYQPDVDLLFAWFGAPQEARNIEVEDGVYVRVVPDAKRVVGIEVLDCAARFRLEPSKIDRSFAERLIERYSAAALARI